MLFEPYELDHDGPVVTARVNTPELSHADMVEMCQDCVEKLRYHSARTFIFDLEKVEFLASACIGALVELLREVEPVRGRIGLAGCRENVAFLFKVTKLDDIFVLCDDVDDALVALRDDQR